MSKSATPPATSAAPGGTLSDRRVSALRALASDPSASDNERSMARKALERAGLEVAPPTKEVSEEIKVASEDERMLLIYAAKHFGFESYRVRSGTRGRWRQSVLVEGPDYMLPILKSAFERQRAALKASMEGALHGFCHGAFPQTPVDSPDDYEPPTKEFLDSYFAAKNTGARVRGDRALPQPSLSDTHEVTA